MDSLVKLEVAMGQCYFVKKATHVKRCGCEICDDTGEVMIKGHRFICPKCEGSGSGNKYEQRWEVSGPHQMKEFHFVSFIGVTKYILDVDGCDVEVSSDNVFASYDEAEKVAENRNRAETEVVRFLLAQ